jgi:hypothetical protein
VTKRQRKRKGRSQKEKEWNEKDREEREVEIEEGTKVQRGEIVRDREKKNRRVREIER